MYDNKRISGSLIAAIAVFGSCCLAAPLYGASGQEPGEVSEVSAQQRADVMRFEALPRQRKPELAAAADTAIVLAAREGSLLAIDVQSSDEYRLGPVQEKARIENPRLVSHGDQVLALWQERYRVESDHKERIDSWMTVSRDDGETFGQPLRLGEEGWFVAAGEPAVTDSGEVWALTEEWMLEDRVPALRLYRINSDDELRSMAVAQGESGDRWKDARLATDGDEAWVAWLRVGTFGTSADLRHSVHPGAQWSSLPSLAMDGDPVGLRLVRSGDAIFLYWMDKKTGRLFGRYLVDGGDDWQEVEGMPGNDESRLLGFAVKVAGNGAVHLLYGQAPDQESRPGIMHSVAPDGRAFLRPAQLETRKQPHSATADWPVIAFGEGGRTVYAAWSDLRHFRPVIYGNVSRDGGKTWRSEDFVLSTDAGRRMHMYPALAVPAAGKPLVAWTRFDDARLKERHTEVVPFLTEGREPPMEPDLEQLHARVEQYWGHRQAQEHEQTFSLYDPFYREKATVKGHVDVRTKYTILIHDFEIGEIEEVTPGRAKVRVRIEHEVEPFTLPDGREASISREWIDADQEWIWVDDAWHLVYLDMMRKPVVRF